MSLQPKLSHDTIESRDGFKVGRPRLSRVFSSSNQTVDGHRPRPSDPPIALRGDRLAAS